jgi:hypothetical protein
MGFVWRVGDERDIQIWGEKWIPTPMSFSIQSPRRILTEDARVMELINQDTKWWNSCLIKEIFHEEEARVICTIPLSLVPTKDSLIWRGTSNGVFLVRSAYHMEKDLQASRHSGGSRHDTGTVIWKTIWNLKIPNESKHFMWRACNDLFRTKANLQRRRVVPNPICPICEREVETVKYIL